MRNKPPANKTPDSLIIWDVLGLIKSKKLDLRGQMDKQLRHKDKSIKYVKTVHSHHFFNRLPSNYRPHTPIIYLS